MTNVSDYKPKETGKKRALCIILPDEKTTYYSLANLFITQLYIELVKSVDERGGRLKNRVNFLLDEFGNFAQIPDFSNKLTVGGGRGIRFNLFLQSFAQLDEIRLISRPYTLITSRNTPAIMYSPDLSKWKFNKIFGLGDKEHNRKVRQLRENRREVRSSSMKDMDLWGVWLITQLMTN